MMCIMEVNVGNLALGNINKQGTEVNYRFSNTGPPIYIHTYCIAGNFRIFADGQSAKFSRFNFRRRAPSCPLYTVQSYLFRGSNFRG